ncbi:PREDICTED: F-box/kelch-repeat protein At3g06240-like [Erythranthe guttata]|uniref:F-box/kelch-repeat protein At3g06240-like n=1 Tax=Erythranthe guttata TaxID=4155 RepID=UPI00064DA198|nr:PREDICTED: F-box/kelch-repeat protein At3g06240-like [Erythranthe guttata]|eukprot:XP_012833508.1 PREDICTED: F-box/kelch-repeat protein At3g06240-like [Erythranthe guttata]
MAPNTCTSYLPPEIIENILLRSSVKPLLRFKSVSKSWNTLISDPIFVRNHHNQSKKSSSDNLFLCHDYYTLSYSNLYSVVKLEDRKLQTLQVFECSYRWEDYVCSCDGVILLATGCDTYRRFTLWNPSTRTRTELCHPRRRIEASYGLSRDPTTGDFKVVVVGWRDSYSVYSCNNKSWMIFNKEHETPPRTGPSSCYRSFPEVCVDGVSYWVWRNTSHIVYHDPRDDKLKILQKPENVDDNETIYLVGLRGSLCMYCKGRDEHTVDFWTKEKGIDNNSWNELMTVENVCMRIWNFQPLCFVEDKIVIQDRRRDKLLAYIPCEKRFEEFEGDAQPFDRVRLPIPYTESLVFPG